MIKLLVIVAILVLMPNLAMAQATPETTSEKSLMMPSAGDLGPGWSVMATKSGMHPDVRLDRFTTTFAGPNGARLVIVILDLPLPISARADAWVRIGDLWQNWASGYEYPGLSPEDRPEIVPISTSLLPLPDGINDGLRYQGDFQFWPIPAAVSLYAIDDGPAVLVNLEGDIQSEHYVAGTDVVINLVLGSMS